jgi:GNAT superfamily N-acetyltransferase
MRVPLGTLPTSFVHEKGNPMSNRVAPGRDYEFADLTTDHPWWDPAVEVLAELRPGLTPERLTSLVDEAGGESLTFTACSDRGDVVGVAGWRVMTTTYADRKLHVDDLVVSARNRSAGVGAALVEHLCDRGRQLTCTVIDLDSRVHRFDAHRFYLRERFDIAAHHFVRSLEPEKI